MKERIEELKRILRPHTTRAYLVGGCVRDMLLGRAISDLDVEVYDIEPEAFADLMERIGAKGVGKSFFVYKWKEIDIALPRLERKIAEGHRGFAVSLAHDEREASRRRDFTMNALMVHLFTHTLLDFWGGVADIRARRIKIVDEKKFCEDSLRVLRAMQFAARLCFRVERRSAEVMRSIDLHDLSPERIFWEFEKMFHAPALHYGLFYLFDLCIAERLFALTITKSQFFHAARAMMRGRSRFVAELYPYYFLYILTDTLGCSYTYLPEKLSAPGRYRKLLAKQVPPPKSIDKCHIARIAIAYPIKEWLGNYLPKVRRIADAIGVWEKPFTGGITASDVMADGVRGREIAQELRRRREARAEALYCHDENKG